MPDSFTCDICRRNVSDPTRKSHKTRDCTLTEIVIHGQTSHDNRDVEAMVTAILEHDKPITSIFVNNTNLTDRGAKAVAMLIKQSQTIAKIDISQNKISNGGVRLILASLAGRRVSLRSLS